MLIGSILIGIAFVIFIAYLINRKKIKKRSVVIFIFIIIFITLGAATYSLATSYQVYDMKGVAKEKNNDFEGALQEYMKAITRNPDDIFAYNQMINIYFQQGDFEKALENSKKLIEIDNNAADYINKGNIEWELKLYDEALKSYKKAIELDANSNLAYYGMGMVYFTKEEYDKAFTNFERYTKKVGKDVDAYYYMGTIMFIQNDLDKSLEFLEKVTEFKEYNNMYIAYFLKGEIYYAKGEYPKAIENYKKSTELNDNFGDAFYNLARAYGITGDNTKALENLKEAVKISDKFKQLAATDNAFNKMIQNPDFIQLIQ